MKRIHYWQNAFANPEILEEYRDTIDAVYQGDLTRVRFEKLNGTKVHSARDNKKRRIFFLNYEGPDGKLHLIVLAVLENHKHSSHPLLKSGGLERFLKLRGAELDSLIMNDESYVSVDEPPVFNTNDIGEPFSFQPVNYINQQFFIPNTTQEEALLATPPFIVTGGPGSGKSCIALILLSQFVEKLSSEEKDKSALYITSSKRLADKMQKEWLNFPVAEKGFHVEFKTYDDLISEAPEREDLKQANLEYFNHWLEGYVDRFNRLKKTNKEEKAMTRGFLNDIKLTFQTFRLINGCKDRESFFTLGENECFFDEKERKWIFTAYEHYLDHLKSVKLYHSDLCSLHHDFRRFDFTVVDELSNLSYGQLRQLALHSEAMVCCGDIKQTLFDRQSKVNFLKNLFQEVYGKQIKPIRLPVTYRCSLPVVEQANRILQVENALAKGVLDKTEEIEIRSFDDKPGKVRLIRPSSSNFEKDLQFFRELALNPDFAVIISDECEKKAAKALLQTPLIFTVSEAQGLDFDELLIWNPFDKKNSSFKKANKDLLTFEDKPLSLHPHLPKKGRGNHQYIIDFNELFTAITRAKRNLYIVQEKRHDIEALFKRTFSQVEEISASLDKAKPACEFKEPSDACPSEKNQPCFDEKWKEKWNERIEILNAEGLKQGIDAAQMVKQKLEELKRKPTSLETETTEIHQRTSTEKPTLKEKPDKPLPSKNISVSARKMPRKSSEKREPKQIVSTGIAQFTNNLFENLNKMNLVRAMNHKCFSRILFETMLPNGLTLFENMKNNEDKWVIFIYFFEEYCQHLKSVLGPKNIVLITNAIIQGRKSRFKKHLLTLEGIIALCEAVNQTPDIVSDITIEDLRTQVQIKSAPSILEILSESVYGINILKCIFEQKPTLANQLLSEDLWGMGATISSVLSNLSTSKEGIGLLLFLISQNPKLFTTIPLQCWTIYFYDCQNLAFCILADLCEMDEGIEFLEQLVRVNSNIVSKEFIHRLTQVNLKAGSTSSTSFMKLIFSSKGMFLFEQMLDIKPEVASWITPDDLFFIDRKEKLSCAFYLSLSALGTQILNKLFNLNKEFYNISQEALFEVNKDSKSSLFFNLSKNLFGLKILKNIDYSVHATSLCIRELKNKLKNGDTHLQLLLSFGNNGIKVLNQIFATNPETAVVLKQCLIERPISPIGYSNFYYLAENSLGISLLKLIFAQKPDVTKNLAKYLYKKINRGHDKGVCMFGLLLRYNEGRKFLLELFSKDPTLAEEIELDLFLDPIYHPEDNNLKFRCKSPAYFSLRNEEGKALIDFFPEKIKSALHEKLKAVDDISDLTQFSFFVRNNLKKEPSIYTMPSLEGYP